jgi:hypothetical protein
VTQSVVQATERAMFSQSVRTQAADGGVQTDQETVSAGQTDHVLADRKGEGFLSCLLLV